MREWEVWDKNHVENLVERGWAAGQERPGRYLKTILSEIEGDSVLDVGCGTGRLVKFLPKEQDYLGVDTSEEMLKIARRRYPDAEFEMGDAYDLGDFRKFDTVVGMALLIHLPDVEPALGEMWSKANRCMLFTVRIKEREKIEKHGSVKLSGGSRSFFSDGKYIIFHSETPETFEDKVGALSGVGEVRSWDYGGVWVYKIAKVGNDG